jgi:hypothetical protein
LDNAAIKKSKKNVNSILYYAQAINMTVLMALSTIATKQIIATKRTLKKGTQLMDYLAHNADAKVRFHASDMIMNIHSDAFYLSETKARSRACGHFFMGRLPKAGNPIKLNGSFHVSTTILPFVVVSAPKADLGRLYPNCQMGIVFRQMLEAMGH